MTYLIISTHNSKQILNVTDEIKGRKVFFTVKSAKEDFGEFNFIYTTEMGVQPNGDMERESGWFYFIYTELNLLVERCGYHLQ